MTGVVGGESGRGSRGGERGRGREWECDKSGREECVERRLRKCESEVGRESGE